ncbi:AraC family transcriptional regulator [Flavisphingomonas formosensis]|uniref:AraC family transcriptional regulator n=1 Tax=Flavisphingomonas formosensis TaxID=861534 RepID=UPI0012FC87E5|nr:AraC family transcriptional regulator [Sphingomonas formosensis]
MTEAATADLLNAMVPLLKMRPVIEDVCRFGGTWESPHAPDGGGWAQFHIVMRGSCIVERPGLDALELNAGDVLLLPHGDAHVVRSHLGGVGRPIVSTLRNGIRRRSIAGESADTELLCGRLWFEAADRHPLLAALPDEIVIHTADEPLLERFRHLLADIRDELDGDRPGAEVIAADLARAVFVMLLRDYLTAEQSAGHTLSLLRDRTTARVVLAMLKDLARAWTLDEMATVAVASRATLVRTFRKHAGMAPMAFLAELRLSAARQRLAGTLDPIARIAADVGYASEGALSRAILKRYGVRPGALRLESVQPSQLAT